MNQTSIKFIGILIIIIVVVVALVLFFWLRSDQSSQPETDLTESNSLGAELLEESQNPIRDKVAETNPFETEANPFGAETNPFQDVKTNPFSD